MTLAHKAKAAAATLCALIVLLPPAQAAKPETRNRAEIPAEFRWDFSRHLPELGGVGSGDDGDGREDGRLRQAQGHARAGACGACSGPTRRYDEIGKLQYRLYRYPQLQRDVDTRDQAVAGRFQRVGALFAKFDTATSWFTPELLKMPQATMDEVDHADARARAVPFHDPRQLPTARRTCSTRRASDCCRWPASSIAAPQDELPGTQHLGHQVSDASSSPTARTWH